MDSFLRLSPDSRWSPVISECSELYRDDAVSAPTLPVWLQYLWHYRTILLLPQGLVVGERNGAEICPNCIRRANNMEDATIRRVQLVLV